MVLRHEGPRRRGRQFGTRAYGIGDAGQLLGRQLPHLLHEDDQAMFGDKGYVNNKLKRLARQAGEFWGVSLKASKPHPLTGANKRFNHRMFSIRARIKHAFRAIKRQFGYTKVRYKGIAKNATKVFAPIGLINLYLARRALMN